MTAMVPPAQIELGKSPRTRKLYESFYFRGNQNQSPYSFWLKHNFLEFRDDSGVRIDNILVLFNELTHESRTYSQSKSISFDEFQNTILNCENYWPHLKVTFEEGGYFELAEKNGQRNLSGTIPTGEGPVEWNFDFPPSGQMYCHFDHPWFYRGFFPKKKILTADCSLHLNGQIHSPFLTTQGTFSGMNGHNWGKEHAVRYAYTNCNEFSENEKPSPETFFDALSAKIKIGPLLSPWLSLGSLYHQGAWYHFNRVFSSYQHHVVNFGLKNYEIHFLNSEHRLELRIHGDHSAWVTLNYDHPSRQASQVNNTKRAQGEIKLFRRRDEKVIAHLTSRNFELETLL